MNENILTRVGGEVTIFINEMGERQKYFLYI